MKSKIQEHFKNKSLKNHYFKDFSTTTYNSRTLQGIKEPLATLSLLFNNVWASCEQPQQAQRTKTYFPWGCNNFNDLSLIWIEIELTKQISKDQKQKKTFSDWKPRKNVSVELHHNFNEFDKKL